MQCITTLLCKQYRFKFFHLTIFGYVFAFFPTLLNILTWFCVELHDRSFRPLVWLWRLFHRCFVRLRRGCDTKSDIIDAFTTFFFILSYYKIMYQTMLLVINHIMIHTDQFGGFYHTYQLVDQSISYGSIHHPTFAVPAPLCNVLPPLILICDTVKAFRPCIYLSKKVHSCYQNSLDGGRDMRGFSGFYFFL